MFYNTDAELRQYISLFESLGYRIGSSVKLRLSTARVYSFESFLKAYIRDSTQLVKYTKKYVPENFKFKKWFVERETQRLMKCSGIPDLAIAFSNNGDIFIIPVEAKRIAETGVQIQLIKYLSCAMEFNHKIQSPKVWNLRTILVAYYSQVSEDTLRNGDLIEIFRPKIKLDVDVLKKISRIVDKMLNAPEQIRKEIRKSIRKTKDNTEKLIILGVILFIGTKMPEVVSDVKIMQTTVKTALEELQQMTDEEIMGAIDSLPSDIIPHLPPKLIPYLNEEQLKYLTPEQIKHLTPEQLKHLTQDQIKYLTQDQIKYLTPEQLKHLTPEQSIIVLEDVSSKFEQLPVEIQKKLKELYRKMFEP